MEIALEAFESRERQHILRAALHEPTVTISSLANVTGVSVATVGRHVDALELLGVVRVDIPRGARRGRTVNVSLDRDVYRAALQAWLQEMGRGLGI